MGKGKSGAGGGGGTYNVTSVTTQGGVTLDLTDTPLVYGQKDAALSGDKRKTIEEFEERRVKNRIEYGTLVDANGDVLIEKKGGRTGVSMPSILYDNAEVMSHNHPRSKDNADILGGTFSTEDMHTFSDVTNLKTMRATSAEGTYSITKTKKFNKNEFKKYTSDFNKKRYNEYSKKEQKLSKDYENGKISYKDYLKGNYKGFNEFLIGFHNDLIAGQKQYGYTYTLEKR